MKDQLKMSYQPTLGGLIDAISSQEEQSGTSLSISPSGTAPSGPAVVLANLSARQAKEKDLLMSGTYGPRGSTLSSSAGLTQSLANKLRVKTDLLGSTLYRLIWKDLITVSGRLIFRLRALELRTKDKGSSSLQIEGSAWPTPKARETADAANKQGGASLDVIANLAVLESAWQTPQATDATGKGRDGRLKKDSHRDPNLQGSYRADLKDEVLRSRIGIVWNGSYVTILAVPDGAQLNPEHSLWLMGIPDAVASCVLQVMRSRRGQPRRSSKAIKKSEPKKGKKAPQCSKPK